MTARWRAASPVLWPRRLPPRVVAVIVESLLEHNMVTAVRLDASASAYTLAPLPYAQVVAALGTAFAAKVTTLD